MLLGTNFLTFHAPQDEEDDEEEEEEEEQGESLITSQAARNHVFPILVNELVKESILTSKQVILQRLLF